MQKYEKGYQEENIDNREESESEENFIFSIQVADYELNIGNKRYKEEIKRMIEKYKPREKFV